MVPFRGWPASGSWCCGARARVRRGRERRWPENVSWHALLYDSQTKIQVPFAG